MIVREPVSVPEGLRERAPTVALFRFPALRFVTGTAGSPVSFVGTRCNARIALSRSTAFVAPCFVTQCWGVILWVEDYCFGCLEFPFR